MTDIKRAARKHAEAYMNRFSAVDDAQRAACVRAGQLTALAEALREKAMGGGAVDLAELVKIEDIAANAVLTLGLPDRAAVSTLRVELVSARPLRDEETGEIRPWDQQDDDGRDAMIEQHCDGVPEGAAAAYEARKRAKEGGEIVRLVHDVSPTAADASVGESSHTDIPPPTNASAATPSPAKAGPTAEQLESHKQAERDRRIAENRRKAGDVLQTGWARAPSQGDPGSGGLYNDPLPVGYGHKRFDHGGWK